jgi:hypothetical protein
VDAATNAINRQLFGTGFMIQIQRKTGILAGIAILAFLIFAAQLGYKGMAARKSDKAREADDKFVQIMLKGKGALVLHDSDIVGQCWRIGQKGEDQRLLYFGINGALAITIVLSPPNGATSARAGGWRIREGRLQIIGANGLAENDYEVLGYGNGKVYVRSLDGSIGSYFVGKE